MNIIIFVIFFVTDIYSQDFCAVDKTLDDLPLIASDWEAENILYGGTGGTAENTVLVGVYNHTQTGCKEQLLQIPALLCPHYKVGTHGVDSLLLTMEAIPNSWAHQFGSKGDNCAVIVFIPSGTTFRQAERFDSLDMTEFALWITPKTKATWEFRNKLSEPIQLFWYKRTEHNIGGLESGAMRSENTYLGHWFVARTVTGELITWLEIASPTGLWEIEPPVCEDEYQCSAEFLEERFAEENLFSSKHNRASLNYVQPKIVANFTTMGFSKYKMPRELYEPILEFWQNNRETQSVNEENGGEVFNQKEVPMHMLHLGHKERNILEVGMKPLLEEWANTKNLQMTSLYGIRWYSRGARLEYHVDTVTTHVISAIINVDQEEMNSDWLLTIYGHDDKVYKIPMEPGDMVFYESAKCLHAREGPMDGKTYANIFIHYVPPSSAWDYSWF